MGTNLHPTIIKFFEDRMSSHSKVAGFRRLPVADEIVYEIERSEFGDVVRVWLADQYTFGEGDFLNRPRELKRGDFVLVARPEASIDMGRDNHSQITVGKLAILMGALNHREMWRYDPPDPKAVRRRTF